MSLNLCHLMENVKNKNEESVGDRKQRYIVIRGKKRDIAFISKYNCSCRLFIDFLSQVKLVRLYSYFVITFIMDGC